MEDGDADPDRAGASAAPLSADLADGHDERGTLVRVSAAMRGKRRLLSSTIDRWGRPLVPRSGVGAWHQHGPRRQRSRAYSSKR